MLSSQDNQAYIHRLQSNLDEIASPKTRNWWHNYLRGVISFRGVGIPAIRIALASWRQDNGLAELPLESQLELALALFEQPIAEDKLAGILYLQEYLYDQFAWDHLLPRYATLFARGLIFDWNTCDWFCVRVLGPTLALHGEPCAAALVSWSEAEDLWQARASVVGFVLVPAEVRFYPYMRTTMQSLIQRPERFAKTGVGWLLRELSRHDQAFVKAFLQDQLVDFSLESLRNATKYFDSVEAQSYIQTFKASPPR